MGCVKTRIRVSNLFNPFLISELELLVDTGVTFTLIPREEIGVEAEAKFKLRTADGRFIEHSLD